VDLPQPDISRVQSSRISKSIRRRSSTETLQQIGGSLLDKVVLANPTWQFLAKGGDLIGNIAPGFPNKNEQPSLPLRLVSPRMPWHDVHTCISGLPALDLSSHFVQACSNPLFIGHSLTLTHTYFLSLPLCESLLLLLLLLLLCLCRDGITID
jgi:hypothetical protein